MNKISVIVPSYNEEKSIMPFYQRTVKVLELIHNTYKDDVAYELIFVNDGSKDNTWNEISNLVKKDGKVIGVNFSRNFGKESAIMAGFQTSSGNCCVVIDCDLQHPPEKISEMYELWRNGYEIIDGIKTDRGKESFLYKSFSNLFYKIMSKAVGFDLKNGSDFKMLDRKVVEILKSLPEYHVFFRGLTYWIGFDRKTIEYEVEERKFGTTKWSSFSLVKYALKNISSFSTKPMQTVTYIGIIFLIFSLLVGLYTILSYLSHSTVSGYSTIVCLILIVGSLNLIGMGIIGYYIAKIFEQVQSRPNYIISTIKRRDKINEKNHN